MPGQQAPTFNSPGQSGPPGLGPIGGQTYPPGSAPSLGFASNPIPSNPQNGSPQNQTFSPASASASGPPQLPAAQTSTPLYSQPPMPMGMQTQQTNNSHSSLPALRPIFGLSLEDLLKRDGSAIPLVVYQCIQAVDLYGLEVEGIYRLSGSATHISKLKTMFDNGRNGSTHFVCERKADIGQIRVSLIFVIRKPSTTM